MTYKALCALLVGSALASSAMAADVTVNGDTTGGATFNRPLAGFPPGDLSFLGTDVRYDVVEFTVAADGAYDFLNTSLTDGFDNFLHIYETGFDPVDPLANVIAGNDDFPTVGLSGFDDLGLLSGATYFAVTSGFTNDDFGQYSLFIEGPGAITIGGAAIPEPATWALMIGGFGLAGAAMRRRRTSVTFA